MSIIQRKAGDILMPSFKTMLEKISGKSFDDVYNDYVNGVKTIDYKKYFRLCRIYAD
jgi:hypothetical protein